MLALGVVLLGCVAGLAVLHADPQGFSGLRNVVHSGDGGGPGTTLGTTSSSSSSSTSSSSTTIGGGGGKPVIDGVQPTSGAAGQVVTISGSGFFSADRRILVLFAGQAAPTRCPSETRCLATAPAGLSGDVAVVVQTESGSSNPARFTYRAG